MILAGPLLAPAAAWHEDFSSEPFGVGWHKFGESSLFQWNESEQRLQATWDSSRPNSYFYRPLQTILTQQDDFSLQFDLRLDSIAVGTTPNKPFTFQLAIGFIRLADATSTNFYRAAGMNQTYGPRNLVELDYFPDSGYGDTWSPTVVSTNNRFAFSSNYPLELTPGDLFQVRMTYSASDRTLRTMVWRNGQQFGLPPSQTLEDVWLGGLDDFRVDAMAICSYSDEQQNPPEFAGSILAQGMVDNIEVTHPDPPVTNLGLGFASGRRQVAFEGRAGWVYALERSADFQVWTEVSWVTVEANGQVVLVDSAGDTPNQAFYRVRSERP